MDIIEQIGTAEQVVIVAVSTATLFWMQWRNFHSLLTHKKREKAKKLEIERKRFSDMYGDLVEVRDELASFLDGMPSRSVYTRCIGKLTILQRNLARLKIPVPNNPPNYEDENLFYNGIVEWFACLAVLAECSKSDDIEGAREHEVHGETEPLRPFTS